jgi:hypothetical protein
MNIYGFIIIIVITLSVVLIIGYFTNVFPFPLRFIDLINILYPPFHPLHPSDSSQSPEPPYPTLPQPPQPIIPTQPPQPPPPPPPEGCGTFVPTNPVPTVPIAGGTVLNLSNLTAMTSAGVKLEEGGTNRVTVENGIVTVSMTPDDLDGNNGKANGERQRTEINITNSAFTAATNTTATWGFNLRVNEVVDWTDTFYHIFQVKMRELDTSPVFTISIQKQHINARSFDGTYVPLMTVCAAVGKWLPVNVTATNKEGGDIKYNIAGFTGTFKMPATTSELYFKAGQYRNITKSNTKPAKTSTSYKDISCKK